jgi:hypothetical protein
MEKNRGGRPPKTGSAARPVSERPRTLASYGITKDKSSKWQKLAAIPDADFEEILQSYKHETGRNSIPTRIGIIRTWNQITAKRRPASLERMALELRKAGWVVLPPIGGQEPGGVK